MGGMLGGGGGGGGGSPAPEYGSGGPGAGYTAPAVASPEAMANRYTAQYAPQTATPFLQNVMAQHSGSPLQQNNNLGLPSLQSMFNMPQRGSPLQASGIQQLAPYVGSTYRPDMSTINKNLSNVAPGVDLQKLAAEEAARKASENAGPLEPAVFDYGQAG